MSTHTIVNLKNDVEDLAPKHGMGDIVESRFARVPLGLTQSGLSHFVIAPGARLPFGHTHSEQEEVYVVVSGSARMKVDDAIVELAAWDALRVAPGAWRGFEGGPDGAEVLAFGAPNTENQDADMEPGWWKD
jgi:mannose-6-phosphate isomerase-like protein (cupin superfamily)